MNEPTKKGATGLETHMTPLEKEVVKFTNLLENEGFRNSIAARLAEFQLNFPDEEETERVIHEIEISIYTGPYKGEKYQELGLIALVKQFMSDVSMAIKEYGREVES